MIPLNSYAQNFEDVMLWRALKHIESGFYIDLGAQDPVVDSVSQVFHERGWKGIHVEPTPHYAQMLRAQRPGDTVIEAAVGNAQGVITFFEIPSTGISTGDPKIAQDHRERGFQIREITVPCIQLASIFKTCGKRDIHWMKIDVEGFELSALTSWGKSQARPWIVVVESTVPMTQIEAHQTWESLLLRRGYAPVYFDGLNRYYVSKEKAELKESFHAPPNVFDSFSVNGTASNSLHYHLNTSHSAKLAEVSAQAQHAASEIAGLKETLISRETVLGGMEREHMAQLEARSAEVMRTSAQLIAAKDNLAVVLQSAQQETLGAALTLSAREREFSENFSALEQAHRTEISILKAEVLRTSAQLIAAKDNLAVVLQSAQQETLVAALASSAREREFSENFSALEQAHRTEISILQAEVLRTSATLIAAKDDISGVLQSAHQEALKSAQALTAREREFSALTASMGSAHRAEILSLQSEVLRANALLLAVKDKFADAVQAAQQEAFKAEKSLLASEQRSLNGANYLAAREREFGEKLLAQADEFFKLQREAEQDKSKLKQEITSTREKLVADNERIMLLKNEKGRIEQDLAKHFAEAGETTAQLQQMIYTVRQEHAVMRNTLSWRLTSPLRAIGQYFGRNPDLNDNELGHDRVRPSPISTGVQEVAPPVHLTTFDSRNLQKEFMSTDLLPDAHSKTSATTNLVESLRLDGKHFIESAYLSLLNRPPDSSGGTFYLDQLLEGVPKIQILDEIGLADEAQRSGALSYEELLSLDGELFIECAFYRLLKRMPDPAGGKFYLDQLFNGVAKVQILEELSSSDEGIQTGVTLPDLQVAFAQFRRASWPLVGFIFRQSSGAEGNSVQERRTRAIEQKMCLLASRNDALLKRIDHGFDSLTNLIIHQRQQQLSSVSQ